MYMTQFPSPDMGMPQMPDGMMPDGFMEAIQELIQAALQMQWAEEWKQCKLTWKPIQETWRWRF